MPRTKIPIAVGGRFGRWTVLKQFDDFNWWCRCDCGIERRVLGCNLRHALSRSCGCLSVEMLVSRSITHGCSRRKTFGKFVCMPEYSVWCGIHERCNRRTSTVYKYYGGRGIKVCKRWKTFENFLKDMGRRPGKGFTLERIDNTRGYSPDNCKWATYREQMRNRRSNHFLTFRGRKQCLAAWGAECGVPQGTIFDRLKLGWTVEEALTVPVKPRHTLTFRGRTLPLSAWAKELGCSYDMLAYRLRKGFSVEQVLATKGRLKSQAIRSGSRDKLPLAREEGA